MNLVAAFEGHPQASTALIQGDRSVTFGELANLVAMNRAMLADNGIGPDDRVAMVAGNEIDFAVGLLAVLGRGAVVTPMLPTNPRPELERKLSAHRPKALLVGHAGRWLTDGSVLDLPVLEVAVRDADASIEAPPVEERADRDLACAMPTSGTESDPKIALLTHGNLAWAQKVLISHTDGLRNDDVSLGALPLSHIFGLNLVLLAGLRVGAATVLQERFREAETLKLVAQHSITVMAGAPVMWQRLVKADGPDDSLVTVRRASSGAAALPRSVYQAVKERFGLEVGQGYGLTETASLVSTSIGVPIKPMSVGVPVDGVDVVIVDEDGAPLESGEVGEIVVRGPNVFEGYLGAPEATEAILSSDGWLWTGDIGLLDDDGYLHIVDRARDMIIVSGFNVFPAEVEAVLKQHPAVDMVMVVGADDDQTGETVVAHLVTNREVNKIDLAKFAREHLSEYKCPTTFRFVEDLPIAATGKPIRRKLRQ